MEETVEKGSWGQRIDAIAEALANIEHGCMQQTQPFEQCNRQAARIYGADDQVSLAQLLKIVQRHVQGKAHLGHASDPELQRIADEPEESPACIVPFNIACLV